jgi:WD40 repeat protein
MKILLLSEEGLGGGPNSSVYLRPLDEPAAIRLGEGVALCLSPDGRWVLTSRTDLGQLVLLPVKAGDVHGLPPDKLTHVGAAWFSDGTRFVFSGNSQGRGGRIYVQDVSDGIPAAITPEGVGSYFSLSPDNKSVAAVGPDKKIYLYSVSGGASQLIRGALTGEIPISWSADGRFLYVYRLGDIPATVFRLELATGRRTLWKELMPADRAGVEIVGPILIAPSGDSYVYSYRRLLSTLYIAEGLK